MGLSSVIRRKKDGEISSTEADAAGLRLVIVEVDEYSNTIVVKSGLKALTRKPIISSSSSNYYNDSSSLITSNGGFSCFLKSCHLCKKPLAPDKDIYMYRGDQGFCSVKCRSRQILLDEMKEDEIKRKRRPKDDAPSTIDCVGCETCRLLEDLRKRRYLRNTTKYKQAHAVISHAKHQQPLLSLS